MASKIAAGTLAVIAFCSLTTLNSVVGQTHGSHPGSHPNQPLKVMAIGDSITQAFTGHAGWRYWLWNDLQAKGVGNVDFIGNNDEHFLGPPLHSTYDMDHEGHWGARADQILAHMPNALNRLGATPNIALIHVGHNDIIQGQSIVATAGEILSLINTMRSFDHDITFIVAKVIPTGSTHTNANLLVLNQLLEQYQPMISTANSPVILADHWTGFDPNTDLYDGVHPNAQGEQKMAATWTRAIGQALGEFKLALELDPATNIVTATNLGGPIDAEYFSVVTLDTMNAHAPGTGWFGGLHISNQEIFSQAAYGSAPFLGTLDGYGSSQGVWWVNSAIIPAGTVFYANSMAYDPATDTILGYATPTSITL